jgi:[histone H3]-lysine4 N-trimethyltransferase SETD1
LGHLQVSLSVHQPDALETVLKDNWELDELLDHARKLILQEYERVAEKDVMERVVAGAVRKKATEAKGKFLETRGKVLNDQKLTERRGLQGLSFKKRTSKVPAPKTEEFAQHIVDESEPPVKKRKKEQFADEPATAVQAQEEPLPDYIERVDKRAATEEDDDLVQPIKKKLKRTTKLAKTPEPHEEIIEEVVVPKDEDYFVPAIREVKPEGKAYISPSPSPPPVPRVDDFGVLDDEDSYFARLVLSGQNQCPEPPTEEDPPAEDKSPSEASRVHITGSARSEGFYKISHAEKASYVSQYQTRGSTVPVRESGTDVQPQQVSSRSNRANARRRAQGLEEINQVQRAVALSRGETNVNELTFKFNQLQSRKKHLRFARSPIHDWGLYAMERIVRGEMVIEYVGEIIRAQVADKREKVYQRQGIGSSYLFRIDEDLVVDATKKGNLG